MALPPEASLTDIKVRIRESVKNPNVGRVEQAVLKEGPRAFRLATLMEILNPERGEVHHYLLKLDSIDRTKAGWFYKPERSISLTGQKPDEIDRLFRFLRAHFEGKLSQPNGELHIISAREYDKLENLLDLVPGLASPDMVELVKLIVPRIKDAASYLDEFIEIFEASDPETVTHIAVASRLVAHQHAFEVLKSLVESSDADEKKYQRVLSANPWMFGSEYSELLDRRHWTRDESLDFMLRRTSDNYLEIIEIKTPFSDPLFRHDKSHNSHYPSEALSRVLGQVMRYVASVERNRDSILVKDGCDTLKIRARVIVGRDGNQAQQEALRAFNAHLHGVEVFTFDQLVRIAARVLSIHRPSADEVPDDESPGQGEPF